MRLIDADALIEKMKDCGFSTAQELMANAFCFAALKSESLAPTVGGWISVKDRLPEISGHYLVSCVTNKTGRRWKVSVNAEWLTSQHEWYIETEDCLATAAGVTVTHYMPLPEPPEEDEA